ncbi:acid phosphatase 1-like [Durio zibethinus]|uniref:Acid phosphatase 1-like n=1 Tax=Durio zibethinus TaxID=66656 RepID=A0A6P5Y2V7_DURZI|nr:acid phosphatase 1-like [Durio zibethinus]
MGQNMIIVMVNWVRETFIFFILAIFSKAIGTNAYSRRSAPADSVPNECLSWRMAVETNNVRGWRTVPTHCLGYIETYMIGGQYEQDVNYIVEQIESYVRDLVVGGDGMDAWILDVDDTCISNIFYYKGKKYGCDPYDPSAFKAWAMKGGCPAIPAVLGLFTKLIDSGFKVFLLTGRDEETLAPSTIANLHNQGFVGYERVIFRTQPFKGKSAVVFKSEIRKQLMEEGYRIWGNVGDQWTDLQGECLGNRTFKLPNPMYCVP